MDFEGGGGHLVLTNCGEWVISDDLEGWKNLTLENTMLEITGKYMGPELINADKDSKLQLNALDVAEDEVPELVGEGEIGLSVNYYGTYREKLLMTMENVQPEGVARGAYQGMAIYGEYVVQCYNSGYVNIYDLGMEDPGSPMAVFKLASYHDGSEAMRPEGEQWDSEFYRNHCNQVMFGAKKWDESDPFPLLYVTTGKKGWKMEDGSYIAKCAVERILYDKETGEWSSQLVQIIEYNDCNYVDEGSGRDGIVTLKNGKFTYSDTEKWKNTEGYEVPCWGWPAGFVDSCPTDVTEDKYFLFSARFSTSYAAVGVTSSGDYSNAIKRFNYTDHNCYIITQFSLPELPKAEDEFGKTVTLTPADIENQFTTEYDIWGTQGGTMYKGRIYYSYGFGAQPGDELFTRKCNGIRVFDIATEQIVAKIDLWKDSEMRTKEPECCAIYQGKLALNYNTGENNLWMFDYIEGLSY